MAANRYGSGRFGSCRTAGRGLPPGRAGWLRRGSLAALAIAVAACGNSDLVLLAAPENTPQSIELSVRALDATRAELTWTSAGAGLAYQIERNGQRLGSTTAQGWTDGGLAAGQRYCWRVLAYGGFGWQARSNEPCVGTDAGTTEWRVETLATGRWPALAVDPAGNLHVCFTREAGGIQYLLAGPGREPETVDADGQGQCSIAVDAAGGVTLAYLSRFGLRQAVREGGRWRASTVDAEAIVGARRFDGPALALAPDGAPRIAYRRVVAGRVALAVASRAQAGWRFDLTAIQGLVGPRSLAVDAGGRSWLATHDELGQATIVWRRDDAGWSVQHTQSLAPNRGDGPPIALDASGVPRTAAWQRAGTAGATVLRWAESTAAGWQTQVVEGVASAGLRVAVVQDGAVARVASIDESGAIRLHARAADGAWRVEPLAGQGGGAAGLDLAVGPDRQLRLVFDRVLEGRVLLASRQQ